jgi:hypothetical protein
MIFFRDILTGGSRQDIARLLRNRFAGNHAILLRKIAPLSFTQGIASQFPGLVLSCRL